MWRFWLVAAGIFLVGEIMTTGFLIFWLGIAALITMIISFFITNLVIQTTVFVISSAILIFATKPLVDKIYKKDNMPTNAFTIVGKKAMVIKNINSIEGKGQIKVNGEVWTAKGLDGIDIKEGTEVEIVEIKGVKAIVTPIRNISTINN